MQKIWSRVYQMPRNSLIVLKLAYADQSVNIITRICAIYRFVLVCVYNICRPFPATQLQGLTPRFTHRFDGPFVVQGHIHGLQDLLKLRHEITGQDIGAVTTEKIVIAPATDPQELRHENETHSLWLPLYVALHPVRIHPGLFKCHVNPRGNRTCERVEF